MLVVLGINYSPLLGQTQINGYIMDEAGKPVIGANVYIENSFDGASSDAKGMFSFQTDQTGTHTLIASFIGHEAVQMPITIAGDPLSLQMILHEKVNEMDMVTITAGTFEAGGEHKTTILKELDIVTTAGATGDIAGVLNTLPGTQTVGEEGKLYVRGGEDYETQTFVDGMRVIRPYQTTIPYTPTRNRFSPFMFKGTSFSTGGYSAEYGQGLSSALILSSKEKADQTRTDFTIIPFGAEIAQCLATEKTSLAGKVGYFNMRPYYAVVPQNLDWIHPPQAVDANLVFRNKIGKTGIIKAYGNFTWGTSQLYQYDIDDPTLKTAFQLDNWYGYLNTSYKNILGKSWTYFIGVSYAANRDEYLFESSEVVEKTSGGQAKLVFNGEISSRLAINTGLDFFQRDQNMDYLDREDTLEAGLSFREQIPAAFLEADFYFTSKFMARMGLRAEYNGLNEMFTLDPRLSLGYTVGKYGNLSFAYGRFHQTTNEDLLLIANHIGNEQSTHYILNYQYINKGKTFRVEGYYKHYDDLVKYDPLDMYNPEGYTNTGKGYARGIDIFWRDSYSTIKNADYWISYSYLDTERDYRDFPGMAIPIFASKHNLSVAYKQFFPKIRSFLSATYTFGSPRPYQDPNADGFNTGRTKCYNDISASIAYMATENIGLFIMSTNILGTEQIFGYRYGNTINDEGLYNRSAIIPPAKRFIIIGATITLSKNGVMNQLRSL